MGWLERLFGRDRRRAETPIVPNPAVRQPLGFQVLFGDSPPSSWHDVLTALRRYHPTAANAMVDVEREAEFAGESHALFGWGEHVVELLGFATPISRETMDAAVRAAPFVDRVKREAMAHQAHVSAYYVGYAVRRFEHYVALAQVAAALAETGGLVVVNEPARISFPAAALMRDAIDGDPHEFLRSIPLPLLYCGFAKIIIQNEPGMWMRTFGGPLLNVPDLAIRGAGPPQGQALFDILAETLSRLLNAGSGTHPGRRLALRPQLTLRFRRPGAGEEFLEPLDNLWIAERDE